MNAKLAPLALCLIPACAGPGTARAPALPSPIAGARAVDELIQPGETHFAHLWQVTFGGQNAEGYWSFEGDRLSFQYTNDDARHSPTWPCDRIFVTDPAGGPPQAVSGGKGVTTCSYFLPGGREVLFASTQAWQEGCPPKADHSQGYTWSVHPEYDIWVRNLDTGAERRITDLWGYDAEATVSPQGDRMVFTSTRSGDIELWTCNLDGGDLRQVTHALGYDGGAFFSHDGKQLVFRSTQFADATRPADEARYRELLDQWKVRPQAMELYIANADGSERRQVTSLGGANFAPYFFPGDRRIIFSSNYLGMEKLAALEARRAEMQPEPYQAAVKAAQAEQRNFDLFAIDAAGGAVERITTFGYFDSFPMFSPDGKFLVFASNRGGSVAGETNLFVAQWQ